MKQNSQAKNIYYILGAIALLAGVMMFKKAPNESLGVNSSAVEVQNYIQGKWAYEIHTGDINNTLRYRFEITGNTLKIWSDIGNIDDPFDMNHDIESHQFSLSEIIRDVDGNPSRYLDFDESNVSLTYRTLSPIWVKLGKSGGLRSDAGIPYWRRGWE